MSPAVAAAAVRVRELAQHELSGWDATVRGFSNSRVVHTLAWAHSLEASGLGLARFLVFEKAGEIVGCLPGLLSEAGPFRMFGSPPPLSHTVSMGPVFDRSRITPSELVEAAIRFLEEQRAVHHIEILSPDLDRETMVRLGFRGEAWPTYRTTLFPRDEARTLRQLEESARRNIARGIRQGLEVRFETDERCVNEHYQQIKEVFLSRGLAVNFERRRVLECFRALRGSGNLVAVSVYLPSRVNIATAMFTLDGNELILWTCARRTRYRWHRPIELMTWSVIQRALSAGCRTFDLTALADLQTEFGAELETGRYRWVRSRYRWLAQMRDLAAKGNRWQLAVRGRVARLGVPIRLGRLEPIPPLRSALRK
jgi:hypothetical protein